MLRRVLGGWGLRAERGRMKITEGLPRGKRSIYARNQMWKLEDIAKFAE